MAAPTRTAASAGNLGRSSVWMSNCPWVWQTRSPAAPVSAGVPCAACPCAACSCTACSCAWLLPAAWPCAGTAGAGRTACPWPAAAAGVSSTRPSIPPQCAAIAPCANSIAHRHSSAVVLRMREERIDITPWEYNGTAKFPCGRSIRGAACAAGAGLQRRLSLRAHNQATAKGPGGQLTCACCWWRTTG